MGENKKDLETFIHGAEEIIDQYPSVKKIIIEREVHNVIIGSDDVEEDE